MMECGVELQGGVDLHATETVDPVVGFGTTLEEERDMWLNTTDQDDLLGVNDATASMFYSDFPSLPDFSCMSSSSSSSSSTPALPLNNIACSTTTTSSCSSASSSSAASWAVLKSDADVEEKNGYMQQQHQHQQQDPIDHAITRTPVTGALSSTASMEISQQQHDPVIVGDCMDGVMEMDTFGYMELLEANEFFDPASIFQNEENPLVEFTQQDQHPHATVLQNMELSAPFQGTTEEDQILESVTATNNNEEEIIQREEEGGIGGADDEMSMVFLEWLKSNKDSVSANDLRNVKLKRATIESAARRLGGGKEGMKQLLKLILEWVQTSHLQNKRRKDNNNNNNIALPQQFLDPCQNQNTNGNSFAPDQSNSCFNQSTTTWLSSPPQPPTNATFGADQAPLMVAPFSQPMVGYVGDPYSASNNHNNPYQPAATEYHMMESTHPWPAHPNSQFAVASHYNQSFGDNSLLQPAAFGGYGGNQYPYQFFHGPGDRLMRLGPSATKEARKKRMARQRRVLSHHRHHNNHHQNQASDPHAMLGTDNCTAVMAANPANWMYWQQTMAPVVPAEPPQAQQPAHQPAERPSMQTQNSHQGRGAASDRRQGWKPEKNLRFLLQKVLKQSDVGSLGRIVLPKKEAETHLPELEARDGISITMEDIGTSRVWNMRYRYWPNNKSRMYLLENTGDFVRANGLQEGDFIVIYSDVKCGKFMIRGVKVRQQGSKPETKKSGKSQKNQQNGINAANTAGAAVGNNGIPSSQKQKTEKGVN